MHTAATAGFLGIFFGLVFLIPVLMFIIGILGTIFWIYMLVHAATNEVENKVVWIIVLVFTHLLGAILYYFIVKKPYDREHKQTVQAVK